MAVFGLRVSGSWYGRMFQKVEQKGRGSCFSFPLTAPPKHNHRLLLSLSSSTSQSPPFLAGLEDVVIGYISGKRKATEVAHSWVFSGFQCVWTRIIRKGDILVDATCGNGYDTLAMLKMVANTGHVYAMDIQEQALENTLSLLKESLNPDEAKNVDLFRTCHSKMEDIVPKRANVRLVTFNLGYLPGGNKAIITKSNTTLEALEAAKRILAPGGLISILVYVGHPGGREEFETVEALASELPVENWICCKLQMLNRPLAPILVLIWKK